MLNFTMAITVLFFLMILLLGSVLAGRKLGKRRIEQKRSKLVVVAAAEGAVFALLGLLIAFTFSGAYERFEARKLNIIEEANAYETAYLRLDLLAPKTLSNNLKTQLGHFLDAHLSIYADIPYMKQVALDREKAKTLKMQLWNDVVNATTMKENQVAQAQVIPAMTNLFDKANTGLALTRLHPPIVIYLLLIVLAAIGGFLVGYTTAENEEHTSIHVLSYVILTAFVLYLVIDLELPRLGLIRVDSFDLFLTEMREDCC